ncbi:unnamed protein product [Sphagnum compactum]
MIEGDGLTSLERTSLFLKLLEDQDRHNGRGRNAKARLITYIFVHAINTIMGTSSSSSSSASSRSLEDNSIYGDGDKWQDAEAAGDYDKWSDQFRKGQ